jgi:hypothetical protein
MSIVEIAMQLGHSPTMTLNTYGHVIAEFKGSPSDPADEHIRRARELAGGPQKDPTKSPLALSPSQNPRKTGSRRPDSNRGPLHYEIAPVVAGVCG